MYKRSVWMDCEGDCDVDVDGSKEDRRNRTVESERGRVEKGPGIARRLNVSREVKADRLNEVHSCCGSMGGI